ncbi:type II-A CRISPR-associated protein Csn2 [Dellaglioa algida]|uniref:type II-A CRISPR-associated protein Csn2 n=1 Tax=Dellaglioa algida TaxID=105612 RepID=UPI0024DE331E|nr:type II-A CRISPR-associated protein Csn2 [Dellaglioa algida]MDK1735392.1 type II-A CRISPR-associated protein Csn2 [Dellaglioa algida]
MKITLYPYQPFEIKSHKITVFSTSSAEVYTKMIAGIKEQQDVVKVSDDQYQVMEITKAIIFGGEVSTIDLNKLFQSRLTKKIIGDLSDGQIQKLNQLDTEMRTAILDIAFMYDISLDVNQEWDIARTIKFFNLTFSNVVQGNSYGIIESIVLTASELNETKIIVLMNVSHYLSISQFNELVRLVATLDVKLFIIEFSEIIYAKKYQNCRYYHIDNDYIEWRYE